MMTFKQQVKYGAIEDGGIIELDGGIIELDGGMLDVDGYMADEDISTDHKRDLCYPQFSK